MNWARFHLFRFLTDNKALRQPGVVAFLAARMLGVFAQQMQAVVVAWQVYDITRTPISLAYAGLAQFLPMVLLLVPAGDLNDRFSRKRILSISWLVAAICSAVLFGLSTVNERGVGGIYAVLVLFGCSRAFTGPALQSLLPQIVPRETLAQALATNSMLTRVAAIAAPMLGGLLYGLGGGMLTYGLCLLAFLLAILLLARVPVLYAAVVVQAGNMWQRATEGIRFIRSHPIVMGTISLDLFAVLLGGVVALLPVYAREILDAGPAGLGVLRSSIAIGAVVMGLYLSARPIQRHVGKVMFGAVALFGMANLVFSLSHWFWLSLICLMVAGAADMVSVYIRSALIQFGTPDSMRGRVNAVNMLFVSSSNELGEFRAGTMAAGLGTVPAAVLGSLCTLGVVAVWMRLFRPLRDVDRLDDAARL